MNPLSTVAERLDNVLYDMERTLQADLLDAELDAARQLAKNQFLRLAGLMWHYSGETFFSGLPGTRYQTAKEKYADQELQRAFQKAWSL